MYGLYKLGACLLIFGFFRLSPRVYMDHLQNLLWPPYWLIFEYWWIKEFWFNFSWSLDVTFNFLLSLEGNHFFLPNSNHGQDTGAYSGLTTIISKRRKTLELFICIMIYDILYQKSLVTLLCTRNTNPLRYRTEEWIGGQIFMLENRFHRSIPWRSWF